MIFLEVKLSDFLSEVLAAIPAAASSPLAIVVYSATAIVWGFIAFRVRALENARASIQNLSEKDGNNGMRIPLGDVPEKRFSSDQYIKLQRKKYLLFAILTLCVTTIATSGLAVKEALDREEFTNILIDEVLEQPSSLYRSAFDLLENTPTAVMDVARTLPPQPSQRELEEVLLDLQARWYDSGQTDRIRAEERSGGEVLDMNEMVQNVVGRGKVGY